MQLRPVFAVLAVLSATPAPARADVPHLLGYQGRLLRADGTAATGTVQVAFAVYDTATGDSPVWTETQTLGLSDGYYATFLGLATTLPDSVFDGSNRWLQVQVGAEPLSPRQQVGSVANALVARTALNVSGTQNLTSLQVGGATVVDSNGRLAGNARYGAGPGISIDPASQIVSIRTCAAGQTLRYEASSWVCTTPSAGTVTEVTGSGPIGVATGTSTPVVSISQAGSLSNGYLSSVDWNSFNARYGSETTCGPGGDLSGPLVAPTVVKLQSRAVSPTQPTIGQVLKWNNNRWEPAADSNSGGTVTQIIGHPPLTVDTSTTSPDISMAAADGTHDGYLSSADWAYFDAKYEASTQCGGDLSGDLSAPAVAKLQSRAVSTAEPAPGQVLYWDGSQWAPTTLAGSDLSDWAPSGYLTLSGDQTISDTKTFTTAPVLTSPLELTSGGTGAADADGARANLSAAASGDNSDITSLSGLTMPLSVAQGGTGTSSFEQGGLLFGSGTGGLAQTGDLVWAGGGMLGVGTAGPVRRLDVDGYALNVGFTSSEGQVRLVLGNRDSAGVPGIVASENGNVRIGSGSGFDQQDGGEFRQSLVVTAAGNVGVGTSSPAAPLEVSGATGSNVAVFRTNDAVAADNGGVILTGTASATATDRRAYVALDADGADFTGGDYFYLMKNGNSGNADFVQQSNADMTFRTNGYANERMRITSGGNVGIGTTAPSATLDVAGSGTINAGGGLKTGGALRLDAGGALQAGVTASTDILTSGTLPTSRGGTGSSAAFTTGSVVFADSDGKLSQDNANLFWDGTNKRLGVGTTVPGLPLDVVGGAKVRSGSSQFLVTFPDGSAVLRGMSQAGAETVNVNSAGPSYFNGGNVGIGTTAPNAKLHVNGGINVGGTESMPSGVSNFLVGKTEIDTGEVDGIDNLVVGNELYTAGNYHDLAMAYRRGGNYAIGMRRVITQSAPSYLNPRMDLFVQGTDTYLPADRVAVMSLTGGGNVGVGTTSPGAPLDVVAGGSFIRLLPASDGIASNAGNLALKAVAASGGIQFHTGGWSGERMRITSGGNVGIGTTSPDALLHTNGAYSGGSGDHTNIAGAQLKLQASSGYIRVPHVSADATTSVVYNYQTGKDVWWGEPSDTGTYHFRGRNLAVDNGNVGVGTTNPGYKLDVNGSFNATSGSIGGNRIATTSSGSLTAVANTAYAGWYRIARSSSVTGSGGTRGGVKVTVTATGNYLGPTQDVVYAFKDWTTTCVLDRVEDRLGGYFSKFRIALDADTAYVEGYLPSLNIGGNSTFSVVVESYGYVLDNWSAYNENLTAGLSSPTASSELAVVVNGTNFANLGASGNVGIGTAASGARLAVGGSGDMVLNTTGFMGLQGPVNQRYMVAVGGAGDRAFTSLATSTNDTAALLVRPASVANASGTGDLSNVLVAGTNLNPAGASAIGASLRVAPSAKGGSGTFDTMATLYVEGAPSGGIGNNYSLKVAGNYGINGEWRNLTVDANAATTIRFDDNTHTFPLTVQNRFGSGYGTGVRFDLGVGSSSAPVIAGSVRMLPEQSWSTTATTQDAAMLFSTIQDGNVYEKMRVTSAGNVGIGTTSPGALLALQSTSGAGATLNVNHPGTADWSGIYFQENGASKAYVQHFGSTRTDAARQNNLELGTLGTNAIQFRPNDAAAMTIVNGGGVGIGTTSPGGYKLSIYDTTSNGLQINSTGVPLMRLAQNGTDLWGWLGQYPANGKSCFYDYNTGVSNCVLTMSGGNVGIGTTSPGKKLDVNGDVNVSGKLYMANPTAFSARGEGQSFGAGTFQLAYTLSGSGSFNVGSAFNDSTNIFTAPVPGLYWFGASCRYDAANVSYFRLFLGVNGTGLDYSYPHSIADFGTNWDPGYATQNVEGVLKLNAGDTVRVMATGESDTSWSHQGEDRFSGYLISAL